MQQPLAKTDKELKHPGLPSPQSLMITGGIITAMLLSLAAFNVAGIQQSLTLWIGLALGYTLFHARFGFTSAFRRLLSVGNGEALRAHMVMLAIACTLFAPILSMGIGLFGTEPSGYVSPVGTSVIVGAFLFGIGMQLGGGCASGTLYAVGGGRSAMFITLFAFIIGSVLGAWHWNFWVNETPSFEAISLATSTGLGYFGAWAVQIAVFAAIFGITYVIAKKRRPPKVKPLPSGKGWIRILRGSWPLWTAAIALAVLNAITLIVRGNPWGVTSAFALWGSKAAAALGIDVTQWVYWSGERAAVLNQSVFADSTSVLNFGVILGAFLASAAGGVFALKKVGLKRASAAIIGGLLMGYGARIAFGCNIGAYFGGIASFSLHGWVWMVMALAGTFIALYLRPMFGMSVPKPKDTFC
ncbi:YeeE/YedE family protein [Pseudalkalibacillus decolorationis]|uniref:YeeE/YedE family protein n=1 Tax=Pseudalkalibacillus decolorationis TaxID=163879 RepID=UPI0021495C51|nr:YeeE/YedE family protein [Pseudalkalibacillus decolorationis]